MLLCLTLVAALGACSGGKNSSSEATSNPSSEVTTAPSAANGAGMNGTAAPPVSQETPDQGAPAGNGGAMAGQTGALGANPGIEPVPSNLDCGSAKPVWVNTHTHVYHVAGDPVYGRTKHGAYMCPQEARTAGYHAAGAGHMGGRKHHRKVNASGASMNGDMASPAPSAT
jgi:hypothetical protein